MRKPSHLCNCGDSVNRTNVRNTIWDWWYYIDSERGTRERKKKYPLRLIGKSKNKRKVSTMCTSIENKSGNFNKLSIKDDRLRTYANEIAKVVADGRKARIQLCGIMAEMESQDIYEQFGGFVPFCEERLGIKKSQAYDMVNVGRVFDIKRENNWQPSLTAKGGAWTQTQLMALLPMAGTGKNKLSASETLANCEELALLGEIAPTMTVKEIKDVVKENRPDAQAKADAKAKREQAKAEKEKAEQEVQASIKGTRIASIEFWQLSGGEIYVLFDGEERDFDADNMAQMADMFVKARNFK